MKAVQGEPVPEKNRIYRIWSEIVLPQFGSTWKACTFLGVNKYVALWDLRKKRIQRISLSSLLRFCGGLGLNLDQLLLDDISTLSPRPREFGLPVAKQVPDSLIIRQIYNVLGRPGARYMTLTELCKEVGIARLKLRRRFPEMWKSLVEHFANQREEKKMIESKLKMRKAVEFIRQEGAEVSDGAITKFARMSRARKGKVCEARQIEALGQLEFDLGQ